MQWMTLLEAASFLFTVLVGCRIAASDLGFCRHQRLQRETPYWIKKKGDRPLLSYSGTIYVDRPRQMAVRCQANGWITFN